jgi:hypothetical protein
VALAEALHYSVLMTSDGALAARAQGSLGGDRVRSVG